MSTAPAAATPSFADLEAEVANVFDFGGDTLTPASEAIIEGAPQPAAPAEGAAPVPAPEPVPSANPTPEAPAAPAPAPAPAEPSAAPAAPVAPSSAPAAPVVDEVALKMNSLEASLAAAVAEIQSLRAAPPAPSGQPGPAPAGGNEPGVETPPEYALAIPKELGDALTNEDPAVVLSGIQHLVNSLAKTIHSSVRKEYVGQIAALKTELQQTGNQAAEAETLKSMRDGYYAKFPSHNDPALSAMIASEAARMGVEFPNAKWDDNYVNALGTRVNNTIARLAGAPAPQPAAAAAPVPPAPAAFSPSAPRSPLPVFGDVAEDIENTFRFDT